MTRRDMARIAYDARAAWLLASGLLATPWDELEPGTREMFAREAEAVAAAERVRIREGLECIPPLGIDHEPFVLRAEVLELLEDRDG